MSTTASELTSAIMLRKIEAERLFAAAAFSKPDLALEQCGWVRPDAFSDPQYRRFWEEFLNCRDANDAAIAVDMKFFADLSVWSFDTFGASPSPFAERLANENWFYTIGGNLSNLAKHVSNGELEASRSLLNSMASESPAVFETVPDVEEASAEFLEALDGPNKTVKSMIGKFDYAYGGFWADGLYVIASRPGVGKTTFLLQVGCNVARSGKKVYLGSLEMGKRELWARKVCGAARISVRDMMAGRLSSQQKVELRRKDAELREMLSGYLYIDDTPSLTTQQLWQKVATLRPDIVLTDHLRLFGDSVRDGNEVQRLGVISWNHKKIAKEFHIPVVAAAQLNRKLEDRAESDKAPRLSDLRDSGQIEENADVVIGLHRERRYIESAPETSPAEMVGLKFRNGPGDIKLTMTFNGLEQWFDDPNWGGGH